MDRRIAPWAAFLACCFLIVGLMGLFASFATQIPLERALSRIAVLDDVRAAARMPADAQRLAALRAQLGDRAGAVLDGAGPIDDRIDRERAAAIAEGTAESDAVTYRVRLLLLFVTLMAGLFGIVLMNLARRA